MRETLSEIDEVLFLPRQSVTFEQMYGAVAAAINNPRAATEWVKVDILFDLNDAADRQQIRDWVNVCLFRFCGHHVYTYYKDFASINPGATLSRLQRIETAIAEYEASLLRPSVQSLR